VDYFVGVIYDGDVGGVVFVDFGWVDVSVDYFGVWGEC